ncbi:glycosyl hydrolase family 18 protein [Streptomyces kronopolitis]|uniref:glycosyl hydrolase family 18 protein n=1 Tax=Streptomyces kronopolitis TaxID=1612435 RepID=UPI00344622C4
MPRTPHPRPPRRGRLLTAPLTALAAAAATLAGSAPATAAEVNAARNAGYESGLSDWTCSAGSGGTVGSPVHSGNGALRATPTAADNATCSQTVAVRPDSTYTLSAYVQGSYVYLGASGTGSTDVSTWTPSATGWQQLRTTFTTGPETTSVTVYTHGWYGQPAYFADDFSVLGPDGGGGTDPGPQVPDAPGGLTAGAVTPSSVSLSWTPAPGATGYTVYRDGTRYAAVSGASATVTGLAAATSYRFQVSATNAAGESARSAQITATTAPSGSGGSPSVPRHAVTGYWQNFDNGATVQKISDVPAAYDIIAVAFADATSTPGAVAFSLDSAGLGGYTVDQFKADIKAKQAAGKSVVLSIGGERGTISVNDAASAAHFADSAYALMQQYGFDGVDIDLENGLDPTYMSQALRSLSQKAGGHLVLTMAPQTLDMQATSAGYFRTALNVKDILTVVNMQYYNSGSMLGCDGKVYAQGTVDFLTALDCLTQGTSCGSFKPARTYPDLRGAMTWSTNWDAANGNAWSNAVGPHVHGLP